MSMHRFQWVVYQLEALRHCSTDVRRTLEGLPNSLEEMYERILKGINQANQKDAYRLLQCLAVAVRPLQVEELAAVLAFNFSKGGLPTLNEDWRWEDRGEAALSACSQLVSVINNNGTRVVQFSHSSVKEFLMSDRLASSMEDISRFHILIEPAHVTLAQACLGALLRLDERTNQKNVKQIPLAQYAGQHWLWHARFGDVESHIVDTLDYFLDVDKPHFTAWVRIQHIDDLLKNVDKYSDERVEAIPHLAAPLYFAVARGFRGLVERLVVKYPQQVNDWGGECGTPLHASALRGRIEVAQLLVAHGADVNFRSSSEVTPLYTELNEMEAEQLIDSGSDSDSDSDVDMRSSHDQTSSEEEFLARDNDSLFDSKDNSNLCERTSLHTASEEGHLEFAEWLLDSGADVNVHDFNQNTPLHLAARCGKLDLARMLLKRGAGVQAWKTRGYSPLFSAVEGGNLDVVRLLLDHGADVHILDKRENNGLHIAAVHGHLEVAQMLLALNVEVNAKNHSGMTPLHRALKNSRETDLVRLLLDHGADVHMHDICRSSTLHHAAEKGNPEIIKMILERNPEVEARDVRGTTPLQAASFTGDPDVVQLLLDHGADPHARDNRGMTALDIAGSLEVSQMLIKLKVSQTCAFLAAAGNGDPEQMQLLLDYGASADVRDDYGFTPLHTAAVRGRLAAFLYLVLELHADVNVQDVEGTTPTDMASQGWTEDPPEVVEFLLEHGGDVKARVDRGETTYELAWAEKKEKIQELLSKYDAAAAA